MLLILRSTARSSLSVRGSPMPVAADPPRPGPDGTAVPAEFVPGAVALVPSAPPDRAPLSDGAPPDDEPADGILDDGAPAEGELPPDDVPPLLDPPVCAKHVPAQDSAAIITIIRSMDASLTFSPARRSSRRAQAATPVWLPFSAPRHPGAPAQAAAWLAAYRQASIQQDHCPCPPEPTGFQPAVMTVVMSSVQLLHHASEAAPARTPQQQHPSPPLFPQAQDPAAGRVSFPSASYRSPSSLRKPTSHRM